MKDSSGLDFGGGGQNSNLMKMVSQPVNLPLIKNDSLRNYFREYCGLIFHCKQVLLVVILLLRFYAQIHCHLENNTCFLVQIMFRPLLLEILSMLLHVSL